MARSILTWKHSLMCLLCLDGHLISIKISGELPFSFHKSHYTRLLLLLTYNTTATLWLQRRMWVISIMTLSSLNTMLPWLWGPEPWSYILLKVTRSKCWHWAGKFKWKNCSFSYGHPFSTFLWRCTKNSTVMKDIKDGNRIYWNRFLFATTIFSSLVPETRMWSWCQFQVAYSNFNFRLQSRSQELFNCFCALSL